MRAYGLTNKELSRLSGVAREVIGDLRRNRTDGVRWDTIGRLCSALGLTSLDKLFRLYEASLFFPIRLRREVTIHLGTDSDAPVQPPPGGGGNGQPVLARQIAGGRDLAALIEITEFLNRVERGVRFRFALHPRNEYGVREAVDGVFRKGNHIVIGSPVANQFAEEVVCRSFGVPPFSPERQTAFPYVFSWSQRRAGASSFGAAAKNGDVGIVSVPTGRLVARRTLVSQGEGEDCALIVVQRLWRPRLRREHGRHDENIIICLLGYSGIGTLAAAHVATQSAFPEELYPPNPGKPLMRVVSTIYMRPPAPTSDDNREVIPGSVRLVPDDEEN